MNAPTMATAVLAKMVEHLLSPICVSLKAKDMHTAVLSQVSGIWQQQMKRNCFDWCTEKEFVLIHH
jgi:hypothetical protein